MKNVAVILSGCGVFDGAEIHESVITLLTLDQENCNTIITAPDIPQYHVINHKAGKPVDTEKRNVLVESARIARGNIVPLEQLDPATVDAVILPGGFGAAKNLSNFALEGTNFHVEPSVHSFLTKAHDLGKPLGFICIAPAIAARIFGHKSVQFTIGNDKATAETLEKWGGKHVECSVREIVVDEKLKIVSTPAYMLAERISEAQAGITKLIYTVLSMA